MKDVFNSLVQSKILVLVMAAIFSTLISYYLISTQEKPKYRSSAVVEIGKYTNLEDEVQFFERRDDIQQNMNSIFIQRLVNDNTKENVNKPNINNKKQNLDSIISIEELNLNQNNQNHNQNNNTQNINNNNNNNNQLNSVFNQQKKNLCCGVDIHYVCSHFENKFKNLEDYPTFAHFGLRKLFLEYLNFPNTCPSRSI